MKKLMKFITWFFITIKVVKLHSIENGEYVTAGVYCWNPISYIITFVTSLIAFFVAGFSAFVETWTDIFAE